MTQAHGLPAPPGTGPELAGRSWRALGVEVHVVVTEPAALEAAATLLAEQLFELDLACSRFRPDGELVALSAGAGRFVPVSALLRRALQVALDAARSTEGDVDPTLGSSLVGLGYDRDFAELVDTGPAVTLRRRAGWRDVVLDDRGAFVPEGVLLDLGATAKALGADLAADRIAAELGGGVLVSLGGDIATAGQSPPSGWPIRVQDVPGPLAEVPTGPYQVVAISSGGLATSSTAARRWQRGGQSMHHILDPRTGQPARSPWRTVSTVGSTCVAANTFSTAAIIRGEQAPAWLREQKVPARLVDQDGQVTRVQGWPEQVAPT